MEKEEFDLVKQHAISRLKEVEQKRRERSWFLSWMRTLPILFNAPLILFRQKL